MASVRGRFAGTGERQRTLHIGRAFWLVGVALLLSLVAGCGSDDQKKIAASAPEPNETDRQTASQAVGVTTTSPSKVNAPADCGTYPGPDGGRARVTLEAGSVSCPAALAVFEDLADGRADQAATGWDCVRGSPDAAKTSDAVSCSRDGVTIVSTKVKAKPPAEPAADPRCQGPNNVPGSYYDPDAGYCLPPSGVEPEG
jgi:hypothetical protein